MGKNKFPAKRVIIDGVTFASKREAKRYAELCLLQKAGEIHQLELQPPFDVYINGKKLCRYTADFRYLDAKTQAFIVEDVKSGGTRKDPYYRLRKKAAEMSYAMTVVEVL